MAANVRPAGPAAVLRHVVNPDPPADRAAVPLQMLIPAFMISELRRAFEIGFLLFLPFVIIDMVVASVLMSMGMMMLPPVVISLPFKLIFFVLVDGWHLVAGSLIRSFSCGGLGRPVRHARPAAGTTPSAVAVHLAIRAEERVERVERRYFLRHAAELQRLRGDVARHVLEQRPLGRVAPCASENFEREAATARACRRRARSRPRP